MGFLKPDMPVVDFAEWSKGTRSEKIRPMARHWAEVGFGTPVVMHLFYVFKILLYILGGWLFALATKGIDGFTNVGQWWSEPIVFQKVVLYTMLFEVVGLGCGFGPLNNRFFPPMGSILYWLRPNTIRLPPWPSRVPLTKGNARTPVDAALYGALLVVLLVALFSNGTGPIPALDTTVGVLPLWQIWTILGLLAVLGLRDKVIFLAARGEVYATFTVTFLFAGRRRHDHRRQARVRGDLDGRGDVEAQQALSVRDLDDDVEQPVDANEVAEAQVLREVSRRSATRPGVAMSSLISAPRSRCWCRWCCSSPMAAGRRRSRHSSWCVSTSASCRRSRWECRWSGTCS